MSNVGVTQSINTKGKLLSDTPENAKLLAHFNKLRGFIASTVKRKFISMMRYGQLSVMANRVPMYLYDAPFLEEKFPTAFTDGTSTFVSVSFLKEMLYDEAKSGGKHNVIPVMLHELQHIMFHHCAPGRLDKIDHGVLNRAYDIVINNLQYSAFNNEDPANDGMEYGDLFMETALGLSDEEREKYRGLSELEVAYILMQEMKKVQQDKDGDKEGDGVSNESQPGGSGDEDSGEGDGEGDDDADSEGDSKGEDDSDSEGEGDGDGEGDGKDKGEGDGEGDDGNLKPASPCAGGDPGAKKGRGLSNTDGDGQTDGVLSGSELRKILEDGGLGDVANKMNLPKNAKEDALAEEVGQANLAQDTARAIQEIAKIEAEGGRAPGASITDYISHKLSVLQDPQMSWQQAVSQVIIGEGQKMTLDMEVPQDLYYVDMSEMGINLSPYEGTHLPSKDQDVTLVVVDTSGSVDESMLQDFFAEISGLAADADGQRVVIVCADTVARGEMAIVEADDADEFFEEVEIYGRGGTDLSRCLVEAINNVKQEVPGELRTVLYFTDMGDEMPRREYLEENINGPLPKTIAFVAPEGLISDADIKAVESFARVYPIAAGDIIDLGETTLSSASM